MTTPWHHTMLGSPLDLTAPHPAHVNIYEMAHAIGRQCRFNGGVLHFYSVAEHSCHMADYARDAGGTLDFQLAALLHDLAEAYTGDITYPVQQVIFSGPGGEEARARYKAMQERLDTIVCEKAGLDIAELHSWAVRQLDLRILLNEREKLLIPCGRKWSFESDELYSKPLPGVEIKLWDPDEATAWWIQRYDRIQRERRAAGRAS